MSLAVEARGQVYMVTAMKRLSLLSAQLCGRVLGWFARRALINSLSVSRQQVSKDGGERNEEEMVLLVSHLASVCMDHVELYRALPRRSIR